MPNTYIDARGNYPGQTGPTRDWHAIAAKEPVYRQEPWQIQANRLPVSLAGAPKRPRTYLQQAPAIPLQRLPVSVRSSNQSPIEAGTGVQSSTWRVSDPAWQDAQQNAVAGLPATIMGGMPGGALPGMGLQGPQDTGAGCGALPSLSGMNISTLALLGAIAGWAVFKFRKG
jgi:hypothetical protein